MQTTTTHTLYRFFDSEGVLLYIGITIDPAVRWRHHARKRDWWLRVSRIEVEHFATRGAVEAAEVAAIKAEKPLFNSTHNGDTNPPKPRSRRVGPTVEPYAIPSGDRQGIMGRPLSPLPSETVIGDDEHADVMRQLPTATECARYAWSHHGPDVGPTAIVRWLSEYGVNISRPTASGLRPK